MAGGSAGPPSDWFRLPRRSMPAPPSGPGRSSHVLVRGRGPIAGLGAARAAKRELWNFPGYAPPRSARGGPISPRRGPHGGSPSRWCGIGREMSRKTGFVATSTDPISPASGGPLWGSGQPPISMGCDGRCAQVVCLRGAGAFRGDGVDVAGAFRLPTTSWDALLARSGRREELTLRCLAGTVRRDRRRSRSCRSGTRRAPRRTLLWGRCRTRPTVRHRARARWRACRRRDSAEVR